VAHRFDVVSVRTDDKRCVVSPAVLGAQPRRAVVLAAGVQSSAIEALDLLTTLGYERQMKRRGRLRGLIQTQ
jgi:hypothetical protein